MHRTSKYFRLYEYLYTQEGEVKLNLADIEQIINRPLPESAALSKSWWSNRKSGAHAGAWLEAGYLVSDVNVKSKQVTFTKRPKLTRLSSNQQWDGESIKALRLHLGLQQREFAEKIGVRQQTISEWEQGTYAPRRSMGKFLSQIAREAGL
jgi:DNA-binding transcriptional regulator YiaG